MTVPFGAILVDNHTLIMVLFVRMVGAMLHPVLVALVMVKVQE